MPAFESIEPAHLLSHVALSGCVVVAIRAVDLSCISADLPMDPAGNYYTA